ncbi:MAG TPA: hypothetical protein VJV39_12245 [Dongiaceae bacterium]|nr:hypothetical protein [Dongiaceae bacterium]
MSSGENAKPPATFEERNPFDISRRSGPEVAAEIAKRMSAWKLARTRTAAQSTTIPGDEAKVSRSAAKSADAKSPPIAAPVQPARMPKAAAPAPQPASPARSAKTSAPRVPYFASASATRRAMPPAPSLKQGSARPQTPTDDELATRADEAAIEIAAPVLEQPRHDDPPLDTVDAAPMTANADAPLTEPAPVVSIDETAIEADAAPAVAPSDPVEAPSVAQASEPIPVEPDDTQRRRAEARAIKARWMAAHDLDAIDTSGAGRDAALTVEPPEVPAMADTGGEAISAHAPQAAAENLDRPLPDEKPDEAASNDELLLDQPIEPERDAVLEAVTEVEELAPEIGVASDAAAGRLEPTFDAPIMRAMPAPVVDRAVTRETHALDLAALDEMAGRKEPTFDPPVAHAETSDVVREPEVAPRDAVAEALRPRPAAQPAAEPAVFAHRDAADDGLSIAALDEAAGRKEPTFDEPIQRKAAAIEPPVRAADRPREPRIEAAPEPRSDEPASDVAPEDDSPELGIAALDEAAGRKEPTIDEPVRPAQPAAAPIAAPRVKLRPIETRIEVRRVDTLRADPQLSARRPIFPHIGPEEWDIPPAIATHASRERRGTSWAIGLGTVLLIAGITAPAAIWQQGRQAEDQVARVAPAPAPQQLPATTATTTAQPPSDQAEATLPEAPQPETPPAVPAVTAQQSSAPSAPEQAEPEAEQAAAGSKPATTLGAVTDGGDVNKSPVIAPPLPTVNLASQTNGTSDPMVARPFVPAQGEGPFLRAPTTGSATVPVAGAPVQSAAVGVRPNLMGQLKPKATSTVSAAKPVANKPRPAVRKPFFQQSPDQMFDTLIETLSEGKPVNPATKPVSPSDRR